MSMDSAGRKQRKFIGLRFAINGLKEVFLRERNFRIHLLIAGLACLMGVWLLISWIEWAILITIIALVLTLEVINSSIERVIDYLAPEQHPLARIIKDMAAAAVLIAAIASILIGMCIFLPKMLLL
ncbi:diacylglycerol kinase family protein [Halobacillus shinanisalinarum]|uniref:Diacylglycerol kinase family protein n=1 Tax=Halobacillus shinanisalinarum TaxID=2932258 RepID=A0ABY4H092_9BACI|nr:diacylglycerol kinase family protein [Halobacillus shinanisalinarum]UOQ93773.1 diacylglycerol kinase family protein [Halobacillus shinanisalinarum]